MNQSVLAGQMGFVQRADGSRGLDFNPNAVPEVVAFAGAVNEGQPPDRNKYLAAVDAVGLAWSADADGYNNDSLVEMALNEVWFDGAEEMFGPDVTKEQARGLVKDRLLEGMRRTHAFAGADKDADTLLMDDIVKSIDAAGWQRDMSRFSSDARLLRKYTKNEDKEYEFSGAESDADLYNRFMGRGWQNGKRVDAKKWREQWWDETQEGEERPKDEAGWNEVFRDNASGFAAWYREHAVQEAENYSARYRLAARSEVLRRLGDARARGEKLTYSQQRAVVLAVLESKGGGDKDSPYDDAWHWPSVLTEEDVARAEERRMAGLRGRMEDFLGRAAEARQEIAGMREGAVAKREAAALAKVQEAERKQKEKVSAAEQVKEAKALEHRRKVGTDKVVTGWGYDDQDNWDEPEGVRISESRLAEVRKQLGWEEGDGLYVVLKVRDRAALMFPVVGDYEGEDLGVALNARAQEVVTKRGKRGRADFDAEGDGEVVFKIEKKK